MNINIKNQEKIANVLTEVQKRSTARNIDLNDINSEIADLEKFLEDRMLKKNWVGLSYKINAHAQVFPGAYNGRPEATIFEIERKASGWFITDIRRDTCIEQRRVMTSNLSEEQMKNIVDVFSKNVR